VVKEGVGQGGEMTQALYAHMNNKRKMKKKNFPKKKKNGWRSVSSSKSKHEALTSNQKKKR
jgi:predicted DNA-binding transcriptional regulator AlpA